jgi:hypothetical protein
LEEQEEHPSAQEEQLKETVLGKVAEGHSAPSTQVFRLRNRGAVWFCRQEVQLSRTAEQLAQG